MSRRGRLVIGSIVRFILILVLLSAIACSRGPAPSPGPAGPEATPGESAPAHPAPAAERPEPASGGTQSPLPIEPALQATERPNKWGVHLLLDDGVGQWP